ncbi:cadherin EGF LAG seven-pass G-type receptor 2-like [Pimephales promelas]|uniref:cadherin EGF LAG seven-pass G-type receptor 2-like n=1 Tax=Pimephales promelas TaxID=90988 RepID=UPI00195590C0|nr:cadherin EGF LAG seven-pass G-type receptor 2-like [Pimephales promelas]
MEKIDLFYILFILACLHVHSVRSPVGTSEINCETGTNKYLGSVPEGYTGNVEIITNIGPDDRLVLEGYFDSIAENFLELIYFNGTSNATVRTIKPLDADELKESGGSLYYSVTCSNTGLKNARALDIQDVNDNPPIFQNKTYSATVSETTAVGSDVLRVIAEDADVSPEKNNITYSIQSPAPDEFEVRSDGNIRLKQRLNYDNAQEYIFTVQATDKDKEEFSDTTTVTITVEDFDNLNPYFDHSFYKASIEENQVGPFSEVTPEAIKAQDGDTGINETVLYNITAVIPNEYQSNFDINQNSGVIFVKTALDREEIDQITVYIQATQQDDASKTANTVVSVTIEDVNDNPPKFDQDEYTVSILENSPQSQFVLQTRVTDLDLGGFSKGHFIMVSDTFAINSQGVISLRSDATLDRETVDSYILQVVAVDQPVDGLSSTAQVIITVLDLNDNNPQFLPLPEIIEIQEGVYTSSSPGDVSKISATDADIGDNGRVTITTFSQNEIFRFREDGTLLAIEELDRETQDVYDVVIVAMDHAIPQRNNITKVRVSITDVNDNAPVFSSDTYSKSILVKDGKVGEVLLTLSATDKDAGNNSLISYSFSEDSSMVALDADTGDITLTSDLGEVTENTLLTLTAIATDHGTPPKSDEAEVLIYFKIAPVNESVSFESSSYNFTIKENEPEASTVGTVKALTGSPLVSVSYNMKSHQDVFSVDGEGTIKALRPLDKEEEEWYILTVEAIDSRTPANTAETMVSVQVENVNEAPVFDGEIYKAEIFSISPYKYPIVKVQAWDPDVGESSELKYSLVESTTLLDVEASTGQVYVLDASRFRDNQLTLQVKATDKHGLFTTTTLQIEVKQSVHRGSVSVISLNQPIYIVEKNIPEMEDSMGKVLGWTVKILSVRAEDGNEMRTILSESTDQTYVSFIAMDSSGAVIQATVVKEKLNTENKELTFELEKVFGPGLEIKVEDSSGGSGESSQTITITLIAVSVVLAVVSVTLALKIIHLVRKKGADSDRQSLSTGIDLPQRKHSLDTLADFNTDQEPTKDEVTQKF